MSRHSTITSSASPTLPSVAVLIVVAACNGNDPSGLGRSTGTVQVTVTMTGVELPPVYGARAEQRTVYADRGAPVRLTQIKPGVQQVQLVIASNCSAAGENPVDVTVVAGQTVTVPFTVTCRATTGFLRVTAPATGTEVPAVGVTVTATGINHVGMRYERTEVVGQDGAVFAVPTGSARLTLKGLALNCYSADPATRTVEVRPSDTTVVIYAVNCEAKAQLAYVLYGLNRDIYLMYEDGTDVRRLTFDDARDEDPAWSPDGRRIAFASDRDGNQEIYVMNADGSDPVRLTSNAAADYHPAWSPDGTRIAFASTRRGGVAKIFVMDADGANAVGLTSGSGEDSDPAWSPDGKRIAFTNMHDDRTAVWVVNTNGSGATLVSADGRQPAWSPDGTAIAYTMSVCPARYYYNCFPAIFVDRGRGALPLVQEDDAGERPAWSPNGRKIAYTGRSCDYYFMQCVDGPFAIARADGSDVVRGAFGYSPAWRPR